MSNQPDNNITTLRNALFAQLADLREASGPDAVRLAIDKSRAVSELGKTIIDTAKVEVDYLRINKGGETPFLEATGNGNLPPGLPGGPADPGNAITGVTRHLLR